MAVLTLSRWTTFECAHHLPMMPEAHKCRRVHGHTYKLTITCRGRVGEDGLVFDNFRIDEVLMVVRAQIDHQNLNEIGMPFSDNPTAERLVEWVWQLATLVPIVGPALHRVTLQEGERSLFSMEAE